ncbi:MAG: hypothetical protein ACLQBX_17700 [Candidatus Limnocylindrales bacterium]
MSVIYADQSDQAVVSGSTRPNDDSASWLADALRRLTHALSGGGSVRITGDASTTRVITRPTLFDEDTSTYARPSATLRELGWAYAQWLSEQPRVVSLANEEHDDLFVEPPDASIWEGLPPTRWGRA